MTLNQLKSAVAALGFERELEDAEALRICANRALRLIFSERGVKSSLWLSTDAPPVRVRIPFISHLSGESITVNLEGNCYSFRAYGTGCYLIKDEGGERKGEFSSFGAKVRGFIKGKAEITFLGDSFYTVHELCAFESIAEGEIGSIPIRMPERIIDIKKLIPDFLSFVGLPSDSYGREIKKVTMQDGRISFPWEMKGEIKLTYLRTPTPITLDGDKEIDLPSDCEELLPLLTASFMWLDDDAEKAQYYMALYKDALATVKRYLNSGIDAVYRTNGWA